MNYFYEYKKYFVIGGIISFIVLVFISYVFLYEEEKITSPNTPSIIEEIKPFYVDVKGAVKKPGVYLFQDGERVIDAIEAAGGLTKNGNTRNINLSQKLTSEMVVYVFTTNQIKSGSKAINCSTICNTNVIDINNCYGNDNTSGKVNINTDGVERLITLPGIGEARAKTIIEYRNEHGPFERIEDIMKVSGIGEASFAKIKDFITV